MFESSTLEEKQRAFQSMLLTGRILVWVNMVNQAVVVPHALRITPQSPLAYSPAVRPRATDEGIAAQMWLGGRVFETFVPWTAVYFVGSRRGHMSWLEHAPPDLGADDLANIVAELDAEYDDPIRGETDAESVVGTASGVGVRVSELAVAAPPLPEAFEAGDVAEPAHEGTASSTGTNAARASSPNLTVILGGGREDSGD